MNSNDIHGLPVINLADGTRAGTVDELLLDLEAKRIVGVTISPGTGLFGGGGDERPNHRRVGDPRPRPRRPHGR